MPATSPRICPSPALVPRDSRGSVLVVALLVAALIALVLGSYLSLNLGSARLSQRTFDRGAAFHLAEAGLEEGLWTYNRLLGRHADAWDGWQIADEAAWRRFDGFSLTPSTTGTIKVYAHPVAPAEEMRPTLVALASVHSPGGAPVTQMLEVALRRRSFFGAGLVARDSLAFRGRNTTFDSWDSDPDQNSATPALAYADAPASDTGAVATGADTSADLDLNKARIHGYVHTRNLVPVLQSPGLIGPFGTADGEIDPARVGQDYNDDFPVITPPADGVFIATFGATLGTSGMATSWRAPALRLSGSDTLTILGDVTLVLTDPLDALAITGKAGVVIPAGSSLTIYFEGDVLLSGQGIVNANANPGSLQLWSTAPGTRMPRFTLAGQGLLSALIYAPEVDFSAVGNAVFSGSLIARHVTFTGNAAFHYDHALARIVRHAPWRGTGWRTVDDPAARAALLPLVDR